MSQENTDHPGVSGKSASGDVWIDTEKYQAQKEFIDDYEVKLTKEMVEQAFLSAPEVDIAQVDVRVDGDQVTLLGIVENAEEERALQKIAENVPGVFEVHMELVTRHGRSL